LPEGDTIHRIARALGRELPGNEIALLETHDLGPVRELAGKRVESVEAHGKHLLVHIETDWTLRVHLGMHGNWRKLHVRERRPPRPTVVLVVGDVAYVCSRAYRAELIRTARLRTHPRLARLGPDLLADEPDFDAIVERAALDAHKDREVAEVLLDQRVGSGIGNVYKSEILFARRVHPRTKMNALDRAALHAMFTEAARLMRLNLATKRRTSVPLQRRPHPGSGRLHVYGRNGKPCLDCGSSIERFLQGDMARSTYFCPRCQALRGEAGEGGA
jgi:endonuclease-8